MYVYQVIWTCDETLRKIYDGNQRHFLHFHFLFTLVILSLKPDVGSISIWRW